MKTFVEIGTCDFDTLYHLTEKGWKGVMIDPYQPFLDKFKDNKNLIKECVAISDTEGVADYYKIKDENLFKPGIMEEVYKGLGSISNLSILRESDFYVGKLENFEVPTTTFNLLMDKLKITEIDFLKIDTEGMDLKIIKSIDFDKINIKLIKVETVYCDPSEMGSYLDDMGYHIEYFENDIIAIKY